jgi:hypothetical protein
MPELNPRQFPKPSASDRAAALQDTWKHGHPETRAVVWTKAPEGQEKGARYEGSHVSPSKNGLTLHGSGPKAMPFSNDAVDEVHYVNPRG